MTFYENSLYPFPTRTILDDSLLFLPAALFWNPLKPGEEFRHIYINKV